MTADIRSAMSTGQPAESGAPGADGAVAPGADGAVPYAVADQATPDGAPDGHAGRNGQVARTEDGAEEQAGVTGPPVDGHAPDPRPEEAAGLDGAPDRARDGAAPEPADAGPADAGPAEAGHPGARDEPVETGPAAAGHAEARDEPVRAGHAEARDEPVDGDGPLDEDVVAAEVADRLGAVVGDDVEADPAEFAAAAVLDVLRASGWADAAEAAELRAEAERTRELLNMVVRDHRAREASAAGSENQQLYWLVPLLRAAHGVAFGSLGAKVALRTAVQDVPPEILAQAGLRIDYGVEHAAADDQRD